MATMRLTVIKVPVRGVDRLRNSRLVTFDPRSIEKKDRGGVSVSHPFSNAALSLGGFVRV